MSLRVKFADSGCWEFQSFLDQDGYPIVTFSDGPKKAHHIHHKCRNRACINPEHLECLSPSEHSLEISNAPAYLNRIKTHCPHGHEYSGANLRIERSAGYRHCLACRRKQDREAHARVRAAKGLAANRA